MGNLWFDDDGGASDGRLFFHTRAMDGLTCSRLPRGQLYNSIGITSGLGDEGGEESQA